MSTIVIGNAGVDSAANRGWLIGHFVDEALGLRQSDEVEIKWGVYDAPESRENWVTAETRTTIAILVSGSCEVIFRDQVATLTEPGDYAMWGKGTDHRWRVPEKAVVVTVRWPSIAPPAQP